MLIYPIYQSFAVQQPYIYYPNRRLILIIGRAATAAIAYCYHSVVDPELS